LGEGVSWGGRGWRAAPLPTLRSARHERETALRPNYGRVAGRPDDCPILPALARSQENVTAKSIAGWLRENRIQAPVVPTGPGQQLTACRESADRGKSAFVLDLTR